MGENIMRTESQEQIAFFQHAEVILRQYKITAPIYAIPNGGQRNAITGARLKKEGVKRGIPDIFFSCARGGFHGLYLDMKREKGGTLSEFQREMIDRLTHEDYCCVVCSGCEEAIQQLTSYIDMGK